MYIEREREIALLKKFYEDRDKRVAVVYGRKGMGKSTLLRNFAKDKNSVYFAAYKTTDTEELRLFARALNREDAKDIKRIMEEIILMAKEDDNPAVVVIDNYPDFVKADPSFEKTLYEYVVGEWKKYPIKLIICGDSFLSMDKILFGKKTLWKDYPFYQIQVGSMSFREARNFFKSENPEEQLFLWAMTGAIPFHLDKITGLSVDEAMVETFFESRRGGHMLPEEIMGIELREMAYYNRMLQTLAKGLQRVNQISDVVGKPKDVVVPYMNALMQIGMVDKETVITEKTNRKKTRYSIVNMCDLFWFKYVADHIDLYYKGETEELKTVILTDVSEYLQEAFIRLSKEYLVTTAADGRMPFTIDEIGNWWLNDEETGTSEGFDIVALGKCEGKDCTIYGRCYFNDKPIEIHELKELIELTKKVERGGDVFYIIFSSEGFNENAKTVAATIKNIMLVTLDDVVKM